jgi:hypothetical protein
MQHSNATLRKNEPLCQPKRAWEMNGRICCASLRTDVRNALATSSRCVVTGGTVARSAAPGGAVDAIVYCS